MSDIEYIHTADDLTDLLEGAELYLRGKLDNVVYDDNTFTVGDVRHHYFVIAFVDWSPAYVNVATADLARSIRIPLGSTVNVKVRVIDEDGTLEAIAIWEPGGVVTPLVEETTQVT